MDPSLPTTAALAIAGDRIAGGVGTHETSLPTPDRVDLRGRCVLPAFTDAHVHFPTWSLSQRDVQLEGAASLEETLARVDGASAAGRVDPRPRLARRPLVGAPVARGARRRHGRDAGGALVEGLPLALGQHRRARPRRRRPGRRRGRRRARRRRRADGRPARGVGVALPRPPRRRLRGRARRCDARGHQARERPRRRRDPRQGRLARRARDLRADPRPRRPHAPRLAVASLRPRGRARGAPAPGRPWRRPPAPGVPQGVHGRDARLADGLDARRERRVHHERRGAGRDHPRGERRRLARGRPRDR